jgi:type II secretory pathway pseudopilin PulG
VITIAVLAVLAAVATPRLAVASARYKLETASARVLADLGQISTRSAAQGANLLFTLDAFRDQYTMIGVPSRGRALYHWVDLSRDPYGVDLLGVDFGGLPFVSFTGHGTPEVSGGFVLAVGTQARRFRLESGSGVVETTSMRLSDTPKNDSLPAVEYAAPPEAADLSQVGTLGRVK